MSVGMGMLIVPPLRPGIGSEGKPAGVGTFGMGTGMLDGMSDASGGGAGRR